MKSTLAAVKRQRFPTRASQPVRGLFILGLGPGLTPFIFVFSTVNKKYMFGIRF